jgi:dTDP-4-dehydrorhamnose 3,5-epimerase
MIFHPAPVAGAWIIELERLTDERGWFARTFDRDEFAARGLTAAVAQCSISSNPRRDTLRGLHYQEEPHGETKLVRCGRGAIWDVGVDLRPGSPTYRGWHGMELTSDQPLMIYWPPGVAHGFQTLRDDTDVVYQMAERFVPDAARGVRWDDSAFAIQWPAPARHRIISERDASYPDHQ